MVHTQLHSPAEAVQGGKGGQLRVFGTEEQVTWPSTAVNSAEALLWTKYCHTASKFGKRYPEMLKKQLGGFSNSC